MLHQHVAGLGEVGLDVAGLDAEEVVEVEALPLIVTSGMIMPTVSPGDMGVEAKTLKLINFKRRNDRHASHSVAADVVDFGVVVAMGMTNLEVTLNAHRVGCMSGGVALAVVMR